MKTSGLQNKSLLLPRKEERNIMNEINAHGTLDGNSEMLPTYKAKKFFC